MKYDLTHNKIIADTVTEDFVLSVDTVLVPLIENKYGIGVAVQMYETSLNLLTKMILCHISTLLQRLMK